MSYHALLTCVGIPALETVLCGKCFADRQNQAYAREMASQSDDTDPAGEFVLCDTCAVNCCVCDGEQP